MPSVTFTTSGVLQKSALRRANDRLVLDTIRRNPGVSRTQLAQITGFSPTSMNFVVNRLLKRSLVREKKRKHEAGSGRPPSGIWLRSDALTAIGVEIARPVSTVILANLEGGIVATHSVPWHENPEHLLESLAVTIRAVGALPEARQVLGVGVSVAGTVERQTGRVIGAENIGWFGVEAGAILRRLVEWPVLFENDANLSAVAEQWYRPRNGPALRYFVYLQMEGGLGSAVVVDGRILHGSSSSGTEFGHITLYPEGHLCSCGNRGCWEQYASDMALVREYRQRAGIDEGAEDIFEESHRVVALAREGDPHALAALHSTARHLGLGLASMIAALNPQAIIIGEPIASAWDLVVDIIQSVLVDRVPSYHRNGLQLMPSHTDTHSALRGAAILALKSYFDHFDQAMPEASPNRVKMEAHELA